MGKELFSLSHQIQKLFLFVIEEKIYLVKRDGCVFLSGIEQVILVFSFMTKIYQD